MTGRGQKISSTQRGGDVKRVSEFLFSEVEQGPNYFQGIA